MDAECRLEKFVSIENLSKVYVSEVYLGCIWATSWVYLGVPGGVSGVYLRCIWVDLVWVGVDLRCIFVDLTYMFPKFQQALKLAESREKQVLTFFVFLPPYIDVSGLLAYCKR